MSSQEHEPRAACVEYGVPKGWIGTCSRGCCVTGRRHANAGAALAAIRPIIESRDIADQLDRSDAWWQRRSRMDEPEPWAFNCTHDPVCDDEQECERRACGLCLDGQPCLEHRVQARDNAAREAAER